MNLLIEYLETQYEWVYQFWMHEVEGWNGKRQALYNNGVVMGKFRERDMATMEVLKVEVEDKALEIEIKKKH